MDDPNDAQGHCFWIVHNPVTPIWFHKPEAQRQRRQVLANTSGARRFHQEGARSVDRIFDSVGCVRIVACYVAPDFKQILYRLRSELITAHAWRLSESQARFLSSSLERTWSESTNSPRCAAA